MNGASPRICNGARAWRSVVAAVLLLAGSLSQAADFVVSDMRVEGLQRISEGTVFNYLPINIGDRVNDLRIQEAIRSLYEQKLFDDVEMRQDGNTLVIAVKERPSIEDFTIEGNKDIKTEDLMESLRGVGLARGRTFDRSVLDNVASFMREQYYDRGKYGVVIDTEVTDRPNNTVRINIDVKEGDRARIRQVNIIGNDSFTDEQVRADFELDTANWLSWFRQDDRYAKESLSGDLEKLRSYYMDRGFADFRVDSTQVAISPNREDIYVTINVHEGERYTISDIKLVGEMVIPEAQLRSLVLAKPGDVFNLQMLTSTSELMSFRLGEQGYANANIEPVPELDYENREVAVTFFIDPQSRVYVRRINFNGIDQIDDEVLRRELRQAEGGYLSNRLVDRSRVRLQRLPYVEAVEVDNTPVPGSPRPCRRRLRSDLSHARPVQRRHRVLGGAAADPQWQYRAHQFPGDRQSRCAAGKLRTLLDAVQSVAHGPLSDDQRRGSYRVGELQGYHPVHVGNVGLLDDVLRWLRKLRVPGHGVPEPELRIDLPAFGTAVVDERDSAVAGVGVEQRRYLR